jgi:hypothetical protein
MKMRFRSIVSLLALTAVGAVLVAGCGGGGSSSSGSSSSGGGSDDFTAAAEAACTSANKQIVALGTPQQEQVTQYLEATEQVIEKLHTEVAAALGSAGSAQAAYVEGLSNAIPILTKMSNAARNENFDAVRELSQGLVEIQLGELAEKAELKSCAEVPVSES